MLTLLFTPVRSLGAATLAMMRATGGITIFAGRAIGGLITPPVFFPQLAQQLVRVGYFSLPVVGLTAIFTGASLAVNTAAGSGDQAVLIIANILSFGIVRELGPVIAALMLAGRVSAAMAAEIGTMRVTEQIDALTTLSTDPFRYLIAPRVGAGLIAMPCLALIADILGLFGGFLIATSILDMPGLLFMEQVLDVLKAGDVLLGMLKGLVFGFLLTLMGCFYGFTSRGGAQGVGQATTNAVSSAMILIIAANFIISRVFVGT